MSVKEWWRRQTGFTDAQAARWENTRERGRRRFVLAEGVLKFGVCCGIITAVATYLLGSPAPLWGLLAINLLLYPLGGFWVGEKTWRDNERRYVEWRRRGPAEQ